MYEIIYTGSAALLIIGFFTAETRRKTKPQKLKGLLRKRQYETVMKKRKEVLWSRAARDRRLQEEAAYEGLKQQRKYLIKRQAEEVKKYNDTRRPFENLIRSGVPIKEVVAMEGYVAPSKQYTLSINVDRHEDKHVKNYINFTDTELEEAREVRRLAKFRHSQKLAASFLANTDIQKFRVNTTAKHKGETTFVYYIKIHKGSRVVWKIGITNSSIETRFKSDIGSARIKTLALWEYANRQDAECHESAIKKVYADHRYVGPKFMRSSGETEMFTHDILGLDN